MGIDRLKKALYLIILVLTFIAGTRIFLCSAADSYQAAVTDISDSRYFDAAHSVLSDAKSSIYVSLFGIIVNEHDKESLPYILLQDLIEAHKRGVKVVVRLNKSYDYRAVEETEKLSQKNDSAFLILSDAGIDCKFASPNSFLHDKLVVIDEETVIEGSMNWSTAALRLNRESASLIKSKEYAREKIERIKNLKVTDDGQLDKFQIETVPIRNKFLRDAEFGAKLVHNKNERGFDVYLYFLKVFHKTGKAKFSLDYENLAAYLGMDQKKSDENRWEINRVLKNLKEQYKLIDCQILAGSPAEITLLDYDNKSKEYQNPKNQYFKVPLAYWEYGWNRKMDLKMKYCYLISVYRAEFSEIKPWWSLPLGLLAKDFHLGKWTIMRGLRNLKKLGVLEVQYDAALDQEGNFSGREPNKYRLKPLLSQEQIDKGWIGLKKTYTGEALDKARELAFLIEQGNDVEITESFIKLMDVYGRERVEKAVKLAAKMRPDNPSRNFGYIVGILRNWDKEGRVDY